MFTGKICINEVNLYDEFGLIAVNIGGGMQEDPFGISQSIIEEKNEYKDNPYFFGVNRQPISFQINFARIYNQKWDYKTKLDFVRLMFTPYYKELKSEDCPQIIYKVICIDTATKVLNGNDQGYITLHFRTDAPWAWGPTTIIQKVVSDVSDTNPFTFKIENKSNVLDWYYPEMEIKSSGSKIKIINERDSDRIFEFNELVDNEIIYINNQTKKIIGNQPYPNNYRLNKFNMNWFRLKYGVNNINIYRDCTISFKLQYPIGL